MGSVAHHPPSVSFLSIPSDVLQLYIFKELDFLSMVAFSRVCRQLRQHTSRHLPKNKLDQNTILQEIFKNGRMNFLSWFQTRLRYPSIDDLIERRPILLERCLKLAAEGFYIIISFIKYIIGVFRWTYECADSAL